MSTIKGILSNEKYKDDALLQKQFTVNYLTKKVKINEGEIPQYYVEGNHPAIIAPDVFDHVQRLMESRLSGQNRKSSVTIFSSKIKCGDCGGWYGSKVWHSTDQYRKVIWRCNHKFDGERKCTTPHLDEETIKQLFLKVVNRYCSERSQIIKSFNAMRTELFDTTELETERDALLQETQVVSDMVQKCIYENAHVALDQAEYQKKYDDLTERYNKAKAQLESVMDEIQERQGKRADTEAFIKAYEALPQQLTEFTTESWLGLVDYATVYSAEDVVFTFKNGQEIKA